MKYARSWRKLLSSTPKIFGVTYMFSRLGSDFHVVVVSQKANELIEFDMVAAMGFPVSAMTICNPVNVV